MRKTLLLAAAMAVMTTTAYAHDVKDNPLRDNNDNYVIGAMTPYPGSPVLKEDADGQIGANFATTWPAETYAISQTHPDPVAGQKVKNSTTAQQ